MIRDQLAHALRAVLATLEVDPLPEEIHLERPARREHGDWSSNVAMATAKKAGWNPRELALAIVERLDADKPPHVEAVEVAGPGFVNFRLADSWLHDVLDDVVTAGTDYARLDIGTGTKVNVEFVSANPTGPLHAGHGRGAAYGDSLARVMARCGYEVHRENYLNDRGMQMQNYIDSLRARKEGRKPSTTDGYQGQYVIDWAEQIPDGVDLYEWGEARAIEDHREVLDQMHVRFDTWFSERSLLEDGAIEQTLTDLEARGVIYTDEGATWLRSTDFGDDKDRVLIKSDGEFTYLLPDIAYHRNKLSRGFDLLIDVWGADHHGYVPRMRAALQSLGHDPSVFEVSIVQLVTLMQDGRVVKISKRTGDIIELREVLDEVGADSARLTYLLQSIDSPQTFDFDVVKSQAMENPVFYVQMAHARIRSIKRVAAERGVERVPFADIDRSLLVHERELEVLRSLSELPDTLAVACHDRTPHRISTWVRELAGTVHGFYHDCYVLGEDIAPELTQARLWLVESAELGLAIGLDLLGVSAPESM